MLVLGPAVPFVGGVVFLNAVLAQPHIGHRKTKTHPMVLMTGYSLVATVRPADVSVVLGAVMTDVTG